MREWNKVDRDSDRIIQRMGRDRDLNGVATMEEVSHNYWEELQRQRRKKKRRKRK